MRFLPYLLVGSMLIPVLLWFVISRSVIQGQANSFVAADLWVLGSLGLCSVAVFVLLSRWMHKVMVQTGA